MANKIKILVVDDAPFILNIIKYNLEKEGFEIVTAENGKDGLKKALEELPDIVLTDIMMPVMSGYEMIQVLRKSPKTKDLPIAILTAHKSRSDLKKALNFGISDYITKPFSPKVLVERVHKILDKHNIT